MLDNRNKPEKPIVVDNRQYSRMIRCPHCNRRISKSYYLNNFNYCHFCGGKIKKEN